MKHRVVNVEASSAKATAHCIHRLSLAVDCSECKAIFQAAAGYSKIREIARRFSTDFDAIENDLAHGETAW